MHYERGVHPMVRRQLSIALACLAAVMQGVPADEPSPPRLRAPSGFVIEQVAAEPAVVFPMFAAFDDRGRLFVTESSGSNDPGPELVKKPECRIRLLEDRDGDGHFETSQVFADKLSLPMGRIEQCRGPHSRRRAARRPLASRASSP